jgi:hypothetical protein
MVEDWLGLPAKEALGGTFDRLPLFRSYSRSRYVQPTERSVRSRRGGAPALQ